MKEGLASFISGFVFAVGLAISGMTQPKKVTAFLDFFGNWDPSLMFVMVGAIAVYSVGYRLILKRPKPLVAGVFQVPSRRDIDGKLIIGAALFGMGWGLVGFCPGPALTSVVSLQWQPLVFVASMLVGMGLFEWMQRISQRKRAGA